METYKLGNKVNCIFRAFHSGKIGDETIQYDNQPYTIVNDIQAELTFNSINKNLTSGMTDLAFSQEKLNEIRLFDIPLTNKILNLIFLKSEEKLCSVSKNFNSDEEGKIYFSKPSEEVYQVFIYDNEGKLEKAYGTFTDDFFQVDKPQSNYLICYSYLGTIGYSFTSNDNLYLTLDLECISNINDETKHMFIHIEKCNLRANRGLTFSQASNTTDLIFRVISDSNNYIVLK